MSFSVNTNVPSKKSQTAHHLHILQQLNLVKLTPKILAKIKTKTKEGDKPTQVKVMVYIKALQWLHPHIPQVLQPIQTRIRLKQI
jgi:SOS-response transcriptional repressor LexA